MVSEVGPAIALSDHGAMCNARWGRLKPWLEKSHADKSGQEDGVGKQVLSEVVLCRQPLDKTRPLCSFIRAVVSSSVSLSQNVVFLQNLSRTATCTITDRSPLGSSVPRVGLNNLICSPVHFLSGHTFPSYLHFWGETSNCHSSACILTDMIKFICENVGTAALI